MFKRAFQFKINTQILPTNDYLHRYRVIDSSMCSICQIERDLVIHSVWEFRVVNDFILQIFNFLNTNSGTNLDIGQADRYWDTSN